MLLKSSFTLKQICLEIIFIFVTLAGCVDKENKGGKVCENKFPVKDYYMNQIDWKYTDALKNCEGARSILFEEVNHILATRTNFPAFKKLRELSSDVFKDEFILCEKISGDLGYNFVVLTKGDLGKITGYATSEEQKVRVVKFHSDMDFDVLKRKVNELGLMSAPANLKNSYVDDGTYYFYILGLNGTLHQTFCYAPGMKEGFFVLSEYLHGLNKATE
jgi:hypothetical protein